MRLRLRATCLLAGIAFCGGPGAAASAGTAEQSQPTHALIARAVSAAPASIAAGAAVVQMDDQGKTTELRPGSNGWTCMPSDPGTPVGRPVCLDQNGLAWFRAAMSGHEPDPGKVGYSYMLQGGTIWSNTDPTATALPKGEKTYIAVPPHIMMLNARLAIESGFPSGQAHPDTTRPFVMYGGTPYAILIMPVR